ncbi:MAG: AraC family transcriptional regulator [Alistipes sp.]
MNPKYEQVPLQKSLYNIKEEFFYNVQVPWHIHLEYELVFIRMDNGIKHVGSHFGGINGAEVLLLGPNLPHNWLVNKKSTNDNTDTDYQVVIHFPKDIFGPEFFELTPFTEINELLKKSELGLCFKDAETPNIGKEMEAMLRMKEFDRSMALLHLLQRLSMQEYTQLSSYGFNNILNEQKVKRMNKVFKYITINYKENISLEDIAEIANMTPQAFCKYFKERTHKTFMEFVNEVRIGHACKLLYEDNFNIMQVCYESGFNNLSNFNRQFKKFTNLSPVEYRKQVLLDAQEGQLS